MNLYWKDRLDVVTLVILHSIYNYKEKKNVGLSSVKTCNY